MLWFLLSLAALITLLLVLPVEIEIDTSRYLYAFRWKGIAGIRGQPEEGHWHWYYRLFFIEREWKPGAGKKPPKPKKKPTAKKRKKGMSALQGWSLLRNLLRCIEVRKFRIDWDTDDFVKNARLYPVWRVLSRGRRQFHINFIGKQDVAIHIRIRPYRVAGAFWRTFVYTKFSKP